MRYSLIALLFICSYIFITLPLSTAFASPEDTQQPVTIEADRAELDEQKELSIYMGNVILRQGNIEIKANTVTVFANKGQLTRITAEGDPVQYRQSRENQEDVHGVSLRMEYETESKRLLLLNSAELWQGKNRFSGERIQYDPDTEKVIATGGTGDNEQGTSRVQITLQPKPREQQNQTPQPGISTEKP